MYVINSLLRKFVCVCVHVLVSEDGGVRDQGIAAEQNATQDSSTLSYVHIDKLGGSYVYTYKKLEP